MDDWEMSVVGCGGARIVRRWSGCLDIGCGFEVTFGDLLFVSSFSAVVYRVVGLDSRCGRYIIGCLICMYIEG